ncbi:antitoxin VapB family protein [Salinarchaeum sp. IM2453]|uniref:antitoxin VapB family protein n=1 Tax=Salinarchaeum sp. IM2453 TaxID=2862870 RepID=UPI001C830D20|nr:antitoxin VapB family protein [Salinarchaeum sp. IM2453]QZA87775.1 antitoxin VapB family protein [Salinarchaeum sp. IM2453]
MGTADEQIRVSTRVKRQLEQRQREDESYNDVLERVLEEDTESDFYDGFGILSDEDAARIREQQKESKKGRKERMRQLDKDI